MSMGTQRKRHPELLRLITLGRGEATIESLAGSLGVSEKNVRIRFRGSAARDAAERKINATQTEAPGPGGSLDVSVRLTSTIEIKSYVLSFGASAEVIEPESLRTEVAQELQQAITRYASDQASPSDQAGSAKP